MAGPAACNHWGVELPPAGLIEGRRLPKRLRVNGGGPWFLAAEGAFELVGRGDLSHANLLAVQEDLRGRVFVSLPFTRPLEEFLEKPNSLLSGYVARRMRRVENSRSRQQPSVAAVARGAQVAVVPDLGVVWVDTHRIFKPGERAPLPWTEPLVELVVVRPRELRTAMERVIGPHGPKRIREEA